MTRILSASRTTAAVAFAALTALATTSCSIFVGPDDELDAEVSFDSSPDAGQNLPDSAAVSVDGRTIAIVGAITTGDPCRELHGAGTITGLKIQVTIRAKSVGEGCIGVLGRFDYEVAVSGVKRGDWVVEVRHLQLGQGDPTVVVTRAVVVP